MKTLMVICNTFATCVKGMVATCQPCVKVTETSWLDVLEVGLVCLAVAVVAIYAIYRFFKWKDDVRQASKESTKNPIGGTCPDNKVKAEYISKLLKHVESLSINENVGKYNDEGSKRYIKELKSLILKGTVTDEEES